MQFELADIHEAMRFLGCEYAEAVEWLEYQHWLVEQEEWAQRNGEYK